MPAYVREAVRRAEEERPGTSHIELPEDVAHQQARRSLRPRAAPRHRRARSRNACACAHAPHHEPGKWHGRRCGHQAMRDARVSYKYVQG